MVWGNCQAAPVASLLTASLAAHGLAVHPVPPVFEIDEAGLADLQQVLRGAAVLITQPVRDEYAIPGCGSEQLAALLPADGRVLTIPVTYDSSAFPYQVTAHRGDGRRVDAPLTDYHDLRCVVAAERGLSVDQAAAWWPEPAADAVRTNAERSRAELARRERALDVAISDQLASPVMHTLDHPANVVLGELARRVLRVLDVGSEVVVPEREFLGARRAPVDRSVVEALGWPASAYRADWEVMHRTLPLAEVLEAQLAFYAEHPDIVSDTRERFAERLTLLGL